jgi:hypothetical protein
MATGAMVPVLIRLHPSDQRLLDVLADELRSGRSGILAIALRHLATTLGKSEPVHMTAPLTNGHRGNLRDSTKAAVRSRK